MPKTSILRVVLALAFACAVFAYPSATQQQEEQRGQWLLLSDGLGRSDPRAECPFKKRLLGLGDDADGGVLGTGDLGFPLTEVGGLLDGLLGRLASGVQPSDKVPDAAHPFQTPGPTDQRGPCPGLNALANHGCTLSPSRLGGRQKSQRVVFWG